MPKSREGTENTMNWLVLVLAGLFEIGWPIGLKIAHSPENRWIGLVIAILCMFISGTLLWLAQRAIPIGTAYAVWTGIGAAGTFLVGAFAFGDATSLLRYLGIVLIIAGIAALKLG
jgi:quaternary ammonium compound-resistance protein SugE